MRNQTIIVVIYLSLFSILIGFIGFLFKHNELNGFMGIGAMVFLLSSTYLLVVNGSFIKSKEFSLIWVGVALIPLGLMFKIMHWPHSMTIFLIGLSLILAAYLIFQIRKHTFTISDAAKIAFLLTILTSNYFRQMHWLYSLELFTLSLFFLSFPVYRFIKKENETKKTLL